ncbi:MAG TPA: alpha-galactosidase [Nocardioides sp.]|uniref:alpha-galactosidase n=1 Tax=Nocardioides sp. TaxID=35761 RepID=UPI002D8066B7|nr:alpha-galactosidase [Nocardioides sp.]HET6654310.1 alpha-galactosidase [Nocardioides sp.]
MSLDPTSWFHLREAGTSLLILLEDGVPVVRHWGADLGDLASEDVAAVATAATRTVNHSSLDRPRVLPLLPDLASGHPGTPSVSGHRAGDAGTVAPSFRTWTAHERDGGVTLVGADPGSGLEVRCDVSLRPSGVVALDYTLTNTGNSRYDVGGVVATLPVPARARELLDLTGRWSRERAPQRMSLRQGTWQRAGRHGRTGHDAPLLTVVGTPGFGFRSGEVWGLHVAWSGDQVSLAERTPEGFSVLGAGELLAPGEVKLDPGTTYQAPTVLAVWSDAGLDGLSHRMHRHVRAMPHLGSRPRPVVLNTWEAVYFDHDEATLKRLADTAAEVGVERFVLDDGWFQGRTDDRRALGDWTVDAERWPRGLHPLVDHVKGLGMEFGLWVEPEMVNEESALARAHPEWLLRGRETLPPTWRHQQVLDLQHPSAYAHVRDALLALLDEYDIAFLKWDHNRDLVDAGHAVDGRRAGAVHGQTLSLYRLLDELLAAHPELEIETCASGGGRVDLGILSRTHRLWASDTNDALERIGIQRWTQLLVPPELVGQHVGAPVAHTTGRTHRLAFRAASALLGHFGVEWDLLSAGPDELRELAGWIATYRELRPLLADGTLVRGDHPDPGLVVTGIVGPDRREAWYVVAQVASSQTTSPAPVLLPGLDPGLRYTVVPAGPRDEGAPGADLSTSWLDEQGDAPLVIPGSALVSAGIQLPVLAPESARVLRVLAV